MSNEPVYDNGLPDPSKLVGPPGRRFPAEILAARIEQQRRQDRSREVALQCAVTFHGPNPDVTASLIVADAADVFLPFLLGEDKPTT